MLEFNLPLIPLVVVYGLPLLIPTIIAEIFLQFSMSYGNISVFIVRSLSSTFRLIFSYLAWRRIAPYVKNMRLKTNYLSILSSIVAIIALIAPWWYFNAKSFNRTIVDFTVYPGWYGGNVGQWINIVRMIGTYFNIDPFTQISNQLLQTLYALLTGTIVAFVGTFVKNNKVGRLLLGSALAVHIWGLLNFYNSWATSLNSLGLSTSGSQSISLAEIGLAEVSWGWGLGIFLVALACCFEGLAVLLHPKMPEKSVYKLICCSLVAVITGVSAIITGILLYSETIEVIFQAEPCSIFWYSLSEFLRVVINIVFLGYIPLWIFIKEQNRRKE